MITGNEFKERITKLVDRIGIGLGVVNPGLFERSLVDDPTRFGKLTLLAKRRIERSVDNEMALDPNAGQTLKLGKYSCALSQKFTLGKEVGLFMCDSPATTIRAKKMVMNAPWPGFAYINAILTANVCVSVGGMEDAYNYTPSAFIDQEYPTLPPSQRITVSGKYTGRTDSLYQPGEEFIFTATIFGTSTIAGGA